MGERSMQTNRNTKSKSWSLVASNLLLIGWQCNHYHYISFEWYWEFINWIPTPRFQVVSLAKHTFKSNELLLVNATRDVPCEFTIGSGYYTTEFWDEDCKMSIFWGVTELRTKLGRGQGDVTLFMDACRSMNSRNVTATFLISCTLLNMANWTVAAYSNSVAFLQNWKRHFPLVLAPKCQVSNYYNSFMVIQDVTTWDVAQCCA